MAASKADLMNMALQSIGSQSTVEDPEERSAAAQQCRKFYDNAFRTVLADFDWSFARKRKALSLHADDPPPHWLFRYALPDLCIAFRKIQNPFGDNTIVIANNWSANTLTQGEARPIPFELELSDDATQRTILTNEESAVGVYTMLLPSLALTSDYFDGAFAHLLGAYVAPGLTGKDEYRKTNLNIYKNLIANAMANDANQQSTTPPEASWITARNG